MINLKYQFQVTKAMVTEYRKTQDKWLYVDYLLESYGIDADDTIIEKVECVLESIDLNSLPR